MASHIERRKFLATLGGAAVCRSRRARSNRAGAAHRCADEWRCNQDGTAQGLRQLGCIGGQGLLKSRMRVVRTAFRLSAENDSPRESLPRHHQHQPRVRGSHREIDPSSKKSVLRCTQAKTERFGAKSKEKTQVTQSLRGNAPFISVDTGSCHLAFVFPRHKELTLD